MRRVALDGRGDLQEWRVQARTLWLAGTPPAEVDWQQRSDEGDLFGSSEPSQSPPPTAQARPLTVPPAFLDLAAAVICHSDPGRFGLLYRLLWRLGDERSLLEVKSDPDVHRAGELAKSVRRDCHKMTAFVRFKEVPGSDGGAGRRRFLAWFEPDHHIVARTAPFFERRFNDMDWMIATPKGSAAWDGQRLAISPMPLQKTDLTDVTDDLWLTYFANIFNPARLKVKAMQSEMPKKYWKNLPEAALIPQLIAEAEANVAEMARKAASQPPLFHERLQQAASRVPVAAALPAGSIEALREEARQCTRCALHCKATQTVFGEGTVDAAVMFVGEQPGDQEDLAGRPFVGPAGKVFNTVLSDIGFPRQAAYVTNAVKHFKYEPRGKRRIHQKPNMGEVDHCRWWLTQELKLVKPKLVVAMGATALASLTGTRQKLADVRGQMMPLTAELSLFATVHPSYLLRIPDEDVRREEMARFVGDMRRVGELASVC